MERSATGYVEILRGGVIVMDYECPICSYHTDDARALVVHLFFESEYVGLYNELQKRWEIE
jgi:hypothetical protein